VSASAPSWKRFDTYPPYQAFLQQAAGASVLALTAASSVEFIAKNTNASTGNNPTSLVIHGTMTIASAAQGLVSYAWGASDLIVADTYNAEYEITWQAGGIETVPNDSFDLFYCVADLEGI
jgi:hypothetical protein